jgi:non-ribosomal peptide synthetase component F
MLASLMLQAFKGFIEQSTRFQWCLDCLTLVHDVGPTEATVLVSAYLATAHSGSSSLPIGRPIHNTRLYVLDPRSLQPLPVGVPGELFISGVCLARGYCSQPQLTAERFLPNPFKQPGDGTGYDRMYRTGDIVAWLANGNVRYGSTHMIERAVNLLASM